MKFFKFYFFIFLFFYFSINVFAEFNDLESFKSDQRISLSLRDIDIIDALKFFSMKCGINVVPTKNVSGRITLNVENAPAKDVFDIMLRSNNLAYDKRGNIYNVMTEAEYKQLYGKNFFDTRQVKIFHLKYAVPEQAFNLLDAIKSDIGRLLVEQESGSALLIDTPEKIKEAEEALSALERQNNFKVFTLKYARARDVEEQLRNQLDLKKVGMVKSDERTNQVIVQTLPERMKNIEELIKSLDKKTKGVLIDTKIIKIKLSDKLTEGIQWEGLFQMAKQFGLAYIGSYPFSAMTAGVTSPTFQTRLDVYNSNSQIGYYPFSGTTSSLNASVKVTPGENLHVGIIDSKRDFDTLINYLKTLGKTKIIASPSLAVVNNQEAKIHIGEKRAYVTTTTTTGTTTKTVAEEVTYINVGVSLSVTPTINDDGYVIMKVKPEISNVISNITTSSGNVIPVLDTNTAETTVIAKDGTTVILGGLGREEIIQEEEGLPVLRKIPILGFLFRSGTKAVERVELVIMLTPIIFEGDKFINPKEKEKLEVKPVKTFDVFKPEQPLKENFPVIKDLKPSMPLSKKEDKDLDYEIKLASKGFISYDFIDIIEKKEDNKEVVKEVLGAKGFKPYN